MGSGENEENWLNWLNWLNWRALQNEVKKSVKKMKEKI